MNPKRRLLFTVTNDLQYDQRMHRICGTLSEAGYSVVLVGRLLPESKPLAQRPFEQVRLACRFRKGFAFYAEYNLRLLFFLLRTPLDGVCSIDLDTLPAGCIATLLRGKVRIFDAHEYFTEVPEVVNRPLVKAFWSGVARLFLPFYRHAYTVGPALAALFRAQHGLPFEVVRNVPLPKPWTGRSGAPPLPRVLLYQGALNEGRGLEAMIDAMPELDNDTELWLAGEGDCSQALRARAQSSPAAARIRFLGFVQPEQLWALTQKAWLGINLLEHRGQSYYFSLANKFFDYVQAGVPVVTMNFPEYAALNQTHEVAVLLDSLDATALAQKITFLKENEAAYLHLHQNCRAAAQEWHWDNEKQTLLAVYEQALGLPISYG